jgi:predicted amidohydrolase
MASKTSSRPRPALPPRSAVRVSCVQWPMQAFDSLPLFIQKVEVLVAAQASYKADFVLFPEFFTAPLLTLAQGLDGLQGMRQLARLTPELVEACARMAVAYRINVIAGTMPVWEKGALYNVAYLCRRDGSIETQYKLHPTPGEVRDWQMQGGTALQVFDTDAGRIGIEVCYDVEFPELARLQAAQGMDILFVPSWTDSKYGYQRVRFCAQARAIENECYVVLGSSVGMLPEVDCLDNQYGQSAVFTPSDYGFPHDAVLAEATANCAMNLVTDLDLGKLVQVRSQGSVRNAQDRRHDLYRLQWLGRKAGKKPSTK